MLKKRFIFFLTIFAFFVLVFNFSLVSASLAGASRVRMLSLSMLLSFFEIALASAFFRLFFKSALGFSKKEHQLSLALNNIEQGVVLYNSSNEVLFLNSKAGEVLGIKFEDIAGVNLSPESSLRNPKLMKLVGVMFFSNLESQGEKKFSLATHEILIEKNVLFLKTIKEEPLWHKTPDLKSIIDTAYRLRTPLSEIKWSLKTLLEGGGITSNQAELLNKSRDAAENSVKLVNDLLDIYKKASEEEKNQ